MCTRELNIFSTKFRINERRWKVLCSLYNVHLTALASRSSVKILTETLYSTHYSYTVLLISHSFTYRILRWEVSKICLVHCGCNEDKPRTATVLLPLPKSSHDFLDVHSGAQSPYKLQYPDPVFKDTVGISKNCIEMNVRTQYLTEWGSRQCLRSAWEKRRLHQWCTIGHMVNENNVICTISAVFYIHTDNKLFFFLEFLSPNNQQKCREFLKFIVFQINPSQILQTQPHLFFIVAWL